MPLNFWTSHKWAKEIQTFYSKAKCCTLTGHCWHCCVGLPNKMPPHIPQSAGWSVCSRKSLYPLQHPVHSCQTLQSRSYRGARSGTSVLLVEFDKMAAHDGNWTTEMEAAAPEEQMNLLLSLLWCKTPGSPTSPEGPVPMETTGNQQCGTETEQQHLSHSSLCLLAFSSSLFLLSWLTCSITEGSSYIQLTKFCWRWKKQLEMGTSRLPVRCF